MEDDRKVNMGGNGKIKCGVTINVGGSEKVQRGKSGNVEWSGKE